MACTYTLTIDGKEVIFDDRAALIKYIRANELYTVISRKIYDLEPEVNTPNLALMLRQMTFGEAHYSPTVMKTFQSNLLENFMELEEEAQFYYKVNSAISLTKGLGKSFEHIDTIKRNMADLGINAEFDKEKIPFDVRYLLTGDVKYTPVEGAYYHKITAKKLKLLGEIDSLSKVSFMDRTDTFIGVSNRVIANLKEAVSLDIEKVKDIRDELAAFMQIAAYKRWISVNDRKTSTLRNSLLYDGDLPTIVDIVKSAQTLSPNNAFLKFVLPVSTIVKSAKKQQRNILNRDLINTIEGKTRGHLEPDMISTLMDSFTELYQNPATTYHAKALFDYLIVKDGLMFKNRSFIRMVPPFMFKDMSDATDIAVQILSATTLDQYKAILKKLNTLEIVNKEGEFIPYFSAEERGKYNTLFKEKDIAGVRDALYTKVFGYSFSQLYNKFESIHNTDIRNQFDLNLVRTKGRSTMTTYLTDKNETYLHITYFTKAYKEAKAEDKKSMKKKLLEELGGAGIAVSPFAESGEGKATDLEFKKYIRVQSAEGKYHLYQLTSVARGQRTHEGDDMIVAGELVPRGTYAVYKEVSAVGTSNSTGVADLGNRPTKDVVQQTIIDKIKQQKPPDRGTPPPPTTPTGPIAPTPTTPTTPTAPASGETIEGGMFGGFQIGDFDPNDLGAGFDISDSEITDVLNNKDQC